MRNPASEPGGPVVRGVRGASVTAGVLVTLPVAAGTASAEAAGRVVQAEPNALTFGLLGPVGMVAVALGVVGMAAGVVRQRRRPRAPEEPAPTAETGASTGAATTSRDTTGAEPLLTASARD